MATTLINSLLSLGTKLQPSITAYAHAASSSSSISNDSERGCALAAQENMERLMVTLKGIKATLLDAEERDIRDHYVKHWLKELQKVAYDAEDMLSEYRYEVTRLQVEARKASEASSSHERKQMELHKISSRFDEIAKDREALQLTESDGVRRPNNKILRPLPGYMVDETIIFGRDAEIKGVIDLLRSLNKEPFSVLSIIGKGALGKTTIAQLVYKDQKDSQRFDLFGWVCVSEEFDVGRLTKQIIESVSKTNYTLSELSSLQEKLAETVKGKTILLVLDDVWNENQSLWDLLRVPFKKAKLVRIIVTTRNKKVAEVMQTTTYFRPTNLPEDLCWQLFQHYAFSGTSDTMPKHLVDVGREIMKNCGGLPLAVKSIASLLRYKTDEKYWKEILESDLWESNSSNDIFPALQISYAHLPPHLKPCFLLCSMYPKDYILEKMDLIELWISLGYIESSGERKIEEIASEYYEELHERSFLDEFSDFYSDEPSGCCKLHDIIHDLARLNSEKEHYSVQINQPLDIKKENVPQEARHLYVGGFIGYVNQILQQNMKGLRTLSMDLRACSSDLEHVYCKNNVEAVDLNSKLSECYKECSIDVQICNLTEFEALRIFELKGNNFTRIPDSISMLKHLAYIGITSSSLTMLPPSIGDLYNLQTLILYCLRLKYLPESIGDLLNLQFLSIQSGLLYELPKSLGSLSNLLRLVIGYNFLEYVPCGLVNFRAIKTMKAWLKVRIVAWLKDMTDLEGNLSIYGVSNLKDAQCANIRNMCKLETLDLCSDPELSDGTENSKLILMVEPEESQDKWDGDEIAVESDGSEDKWDGDEIAVEPEGSEGVCGDDADFSWLESLHPNPNLKKLRVRYFCLATIPGWMSDPCSLQSIQEVLLQGCSHIQSLPFINLGTLKHLTIDKCYGVGVFQLEQLPSQLQELQIKGCASLEFITGLRNLKMLEKLNICSCKVLRSITMDGQQLVESTEPTDGLIPSGPGCDVYVHGCGCPDVQIGIWWNLWSSFDASTRNF